MLNGNDVARPIAIVLGGITNHIHLIDRLHKRGYYVILVDYLDDPPAKAVADEHAQISTFDEEAIEKLAKEHSVSLIINANLEHINAIAIRVSERLGLPVPYSAETALNVSQKSRMKRIMLESGIPTTKYVCTSTLDTCDLGELNFPLFVKPQDGSGSAGVTRVENYKSLIKAFEMAKQYSKNGEVIIEEEALGRECNVYTYINNGKAYVLNVAERYFGTGDGTLLTQCYGTFAPAQINKTAYSTIQTIADAIANAFQLKSCPMFMQVKVNGEQVNVIEFACRMAGGISNQVILNRTGFDWFDATIDAFLGNKIDVKFDDNGMFYIVSSLLSKPGIYGELKGYEELQTEGLMDKISLARKRGAVIDNNRANAEKVGFFTVKDVTKEGALDKVAKCFNRLSLLSIDGEEMLRKDTYIKQGTLELD